MTVDGHVHPAFAEVADRFAKLFRKPGSGGGALCIRVRGDVVVDVWGGFADPYDVTPWTRDTMAMSFSTTKGVASTVIHRLADRGLLDYDDAVADHWPAFGAAGKQDITIRQLLSHQAGLHDVRSLVTEAEQLVDHVRLERLLAEARPDPAPGTGPGYHAFTFGWLLAGLARAITGKGMAELVQAEIAEPLGVDGLFIGAPEDQRQRVARTVTKVGHWDTLRTVTGRAERIERTRRLVEALWVEGLDRLLLDPAQPLLSAEIPAANGCFTARSLATMYGALANGGKVDGVQLLSRSTVNELGRVQTSARDYVIGINMRWRLGYHQAFALGRPPRRAFGHFGFGGSGGWADPTTGMSLAFVTNRLGSATTPVGDARLARLGGLALKAVHQLA